MLAGLSARSFGRFAYFVTRIAAGRVERGLPKALQPLRLPHLLALSGARRLHERAQLPDHRRRAEILSTRRRSAPTGSSRTGSIYDAAARMIERERAQGADVRVRLSRRQSFSLGLSLAARSDAAMEGPRQPAAGRRISAAAGDERQDYAAFLARLKREFPDESFLLVRYGDHQPDFASRMHRTRARRDADRAAADGVTIRAISPPTTPSTRSISSRSICRPRSKRIEGPYLPLVVQEAAGLPLDSSFVEQKRILAALQGAVLCLRGGAEARRFNRLLIDAGLIKGL